MKHMDTEKAARETGCWDGDDFNGFSDIGRCIMILAAIVAVIGLAITYLMLGQTQ